MRTVSINTVQGLGGTEMPQLDITAPNGCVEVTVRADGKVLWVNVDEVCVLRCCQIPELIVEDQRRPE